MDLSNKKIILTGASSGIGLDLLLFPNHFAHVSQIIRTLEPGHISSPGTSLHKAITRRPAQSLYCRLSKTSIIFAGTSWPTILSSTMATGARPQEPKQ